MRKISRDLLKDIQYMYECYGEKIIPTEDHIKPQSEQEKLELIIRTNKIELDVLNGKLLFAFNLPGLYMSISDWDFEKACEKADEIYTQGKKMYLHKNKDEFKTFQNYFGKIIQNIKKTGPMHIGDILTIPDELKLLVDTTLKEINLEKLEYTLNSEIALLKRFYEFKEFVSELPETSFKDPEKFSENLKRTELSLEMLKTTLWPIYKRIRPYAN